MKFVAFIFVVFALVCAVAFGDDPSGTTGDCKWVISKNVLTISGKGNMDDYSLGSAPWNNHKGEYTKIVVGQDVKYIGDCAFANNVNYTEVVVSSAVVSIGSRAFFGTAVEKITFSGVVENIESNAFTSTFILNSVTMKCNNCTIEPLAFSDCGMNTVVIKGSIASLGNNAFASSNKLNRVVLPEVYEMGNTVFSDCSKMNLLYYTGSENPCDKDHGNIFSGTKIDEVVVATSYNYTMFCNVYAKTVSTTTSDASFVSNIALLALVALTMLVAVIMA